ncbi:hypothetical protein AK812_SmicGene16122 [Symbiodinium microadriaticum]|uniref:Uncharacterized protein n=1 Tax=Symbiodinium microadriaticum TaxID=2951 RepID=A0A1Q9E157_SYMMI|nr:hypothetical protein AK812_SmicGene16122 [Symbiodinium microadriaticum]
MARGASSAARTSGPSAWALHVYLFDRRILPASAAAFMQPALARGADSALSRAPLFRNGDCQTAREERTAEK